MLVSSKYLAIKNDVFAEPQLAVPEGGKVAGVLDDVLKNLFTSYIKQAEEFELLKIKLQFCDKHEEKANLLREKEDAEAVTRLLTAIFSFEVEEAFNLHDKLVVGMAAGWTVWYLDKPKEDECDCPPCSLMHTLWGCLKDVRIP